MLAGKAHMRAAHTKVLYGGFMGCGWRRWSDEVGLERLMAVILAWEEWGTVFARVVRGARSWGLRSYRRTGPPCFKNAP